MLEMVWMILKLWRQMMHSMKWKLVMKNTTRWWRKRRVSTTTIIMDGAGTTSLAMSLNLSTCIIQLNSFHPSQATTLSLLPSHPILSSGLSLNTGQQNLINNTPTPCCHHILFFTITTTTTTMCNITANVNII